MREKKGREREKGRNEIGLQNKKERKKNNNKNEMIKKKGKKMKIARHFTL